MRGMARRFERRCDFGKRGGVVTAAMAIVSVWLTRAGMIARIVGMRLLLANAEGVRALCCCRCCAGVSPGMGGVGETR